MKKLNFSINPALHKELKILAAVHGISVAELARNALATAIQPMPMDTQTGVLNRQAPPSPLVTR